MANNKRIRFGPIALTNSVANILNPPTVTGGVNSGSSPCYLLLWHIRVINKTSSAATVSFWIGATGASAAGTEVFGNGLSVSANSFVDIYPSGLRLDSTDFLTALASANTTLTITGEGEIGVSG